MASREPGSSPPLTRYSELQAVIEAVPAVVIVAEDTEARSLRANTAGYELLQALEQQSQRGATSAEAPGTPETADAGMILPNLRRAARGEHVDGWEERLVLRDGREHRFLGTAVPLHGEHGELRGAVVSLVDISERIRAENALKEADRRKDEFLAMLAHELRNPITPIKVALELIQRNLGDQSRRDWAIQVVDRQLVQLTRIIDDLLELGRLVSGNISLKKEASSLRTIVTHAIEASRPRMNANRQILRVDLPTAEIPLLVDPVRLTQALSNLLDNAAKFTAPGGTISVVAVRRDNAVELRVEDTGRGMDPELLPRVFDMFVQAEPDLARAKGGLGIGLSIVRRIVELHGGTVNAYSEGTNKGSEFRVKLPVAVAEAAAQTTAAPPRALGERPVARRVLIVDDNRDITDAIAELLRLSGHEVGRHYEGDGALEKALAFKADVLIIDLGLPGKSGYEVARLVRSHADLKNVPIIAISGYGQAVDLERSKSAGMDFHLLKPVDTQLLGKLIETATTHPN